MFTSAPRSAFAVNKRREPDVVAGGQAEADTAELKGDGTGAGVDGVRFGETEGIEQVNLVVARLHAGSRDKQRVAHLPDSLTAAGRAGVAGREHSCHDHDFQVRCDFAHPGGPGPVEGLGNIQERISERAHGRFREDNQFGAAVFRLPGEIFHEAQISGNIAACDT